MRITLTVDDELLEKAATLAEPGIEQSLLMEKCLEAFIQRETARRLAMLGGNASDIELALRRRFDSPDS